MLVAGALSLSVFTMTASAQIYKFNDSGRYLSNGVITQNEFDDQVEAVLQLFSSLAGAGFVNSAALHNLGGVDIGLRSIFAVVPDEFKDIIPDRVFNNQPVRIKDPLEGTDTVPLPFLNASVGLPANFEVLGRFFYFPLGDKPTDGAVAFLGGALKYGLLRGNLTLPDITVLVGYQTFIVPDEYDFGTVKTFSFKGFVSKGMGFVTLYAGGGLDRTALALKQDRIPFPLPKTEYDGTHTHGTIGLTIKPIPFLRVNADYNFGEFPNFTIGANLSVR
jgi:hypothetical protein